jgi:hypothetical protein
LCETIISGCDSAEIFEPSEHALDGVAVAVKIRREAVLPHSVGFGRDIRSCTLGLDLPANGIAIVAFVTVEQFDRRYLIEQRVGSDAIRHLAPREQEGDRAAEPVGQGVDFGGAAAPRATDRLCVLPPFPPEAQR